MPRLTAPPDRGALVVFTLSSANAFKVRASFFRGLYGYDDKSQFGKYHYRREGLLDRLGYVPLGRGVFIVRADALAQVKRYMKGRAEMVWRTVVLTAKDRRLLAKPAR
jgi:hypothetical protein